MKTIETTGVINDSNIITINKNIAVKYLNKSVRLFILLQDNEKDTDDIDEQLWLKIVSKNSAFDFLHDEDEDIYSITDGKPFNNEI